VAVGSLGRRFLNNFFRLAAKHNLFLPRTVGPRKRRVSDFRWPPLRLCHALNPFHSIVTVNLLKRYWPAGLILAIVVIHAAIIGYVRTRVAKLAKAHSDTVEVGMFRFQNTADLSRVYQFRLHAVVDPSRRIETQELLIKKRYEVQEASELLLRQANVAWLADPAHLDIRDRLLDIITQQLHEPMVKRVLITDWLELPAGTVFSSTLVSASTTPR
jgi:hypothetical protein